MIQQNLLPTYIFVWLHYGRKTAVVVHDDTIIKYIIIYFIIHNGRYDHSLLLPQIRVMV